MMANRCFLRKPLQLAAAWRVGRCIQSPPSPLPSKPNQEIRPQHDPPIMLRQAPQLLRRATSAASMRWRRPFSTDLPAETPVDSKFVGGWRSVIPNIDPPKTPSAFMAPRPPIPSTIPSNLTINIVPPYNSIFSGKEAKSGTSTQVRHLCINPHKESEQLVDKDFDPKIDKTDNLPLKPGFEKKLVCKDGSELLQVTVYATTRRRESAGFAKVDTDYGFAEVETIFLTKETYKKALSILQSVGFTKVDSNYGFAEVETIFLTEETYKKALSILQSVGFAKVDTDSGFTKVETVFLTEETYTKALSILQSAGFTKLDTDSRFAKVDLFFDQGDIQEGTLYFALRKIGEQ